MSFAAQLGKRLRGDEIFNLVGDLGAGKTTFVTGLVSGAGISEPVSSPSFTLRNDYRGKNIHIVHYDLFRLNDRTELGELLSETLNEANTVIAIEWSGALAGMLPKERTITISLKAASEEDLRIAEINFPENYEYLVRKEK